MIETLIGVIDTVERLAFWIINREGYTLGGPFKGVEVGLTRHDCGGLWGIIAPTLVDQMRNNGWLDGHRITAAGRAALIKVADKY